MKRLFIWFAVLLMFAGSWGGVWPRSARAAELGEGLILNYDMSQVEGSTVKDQAGKFDGVWINPQHADWIKSADAGAISFSGSKTNYSYVEIPEGVLNGLTDVTVSALVNWKGASAAEWLYALGQSDTKYLYFTPKYNSDSTARFGIATNGWRNEVAAKSATLPSNDWKLVTTVLTGSTGTLTLYVDGAAVGSGSTNGFTLEQIRKTGGASGYIGKSFYSADPYFGGMVADFRMYNRALTAQEVGSLQTEAAQKQIGGLVVKDAAAQIDYADFLGNNRNKDQVVSNLIFPATGKYGTAIAWESSNKAVISDEGVVTRPSAAGTDQSVVLTATVTDGTHTAKSEFAVTVLRQLAAAESVRLDAEALIVPNLQDVRGNLTLPVTGRQGSTVTWSSEKPAVITPTGEVTRSVYGSGDASVKLIAHVAKDGFVLTKGFEAIVRELPKQEGYAGYLFGYFTGEGYASGEQIYFALSQGNDPLHWQELNEGNPALTSALGDKGVRDPFIIRSPEGDRFYLIATDLKMYGGGSWDTAQRAGSRSIMVWESTDLIQWSNQRMVEVSPPSAGNTWAPEAYYDYSSGEFIVFWASKLYDNDSHTGSSYQRVMAAKTRDFYTFTEPEVYIDRGYSVIDTTMIEQGGKIYRITKDERSNSTASPNGKFVFQEAGSSIFDPNFVMIKEGIGKGSISQGEGPTIFISNTEDKWYLFIDEFGGRGYVPFETTNLSSGVWTLSSGYSLPSRPRHGTVLPITASEYAKLQAHVPAVKQPDNQTHVTAVELDQTKLQLETGQQLQMKATVAPADATNHSVVWSTSNSEVAQVSDNGTVTALKEGIAYVSVATVDGGFLAFTEVKVGQSTTTAGAALTGATEVMPGESFEVLYGLNGLSDAITAQDVTFMYDQEKLELLSAVSAREGVQIVDTKASAGRMRVIAVNLGTVPNGPSIKLIFKAKERQDAAAATIAADLIRVGSKTGEELALLAASHSVLIQEGDRTLLESLIASAQEKHDQAVEGQRIGQYPSGAKATLLSAIEPAKAVSADPNASAEQLKRAIADLNGKLQAFLASEIKKIPGDLNNDGKLSVGDLALLASAYGKNSQDADWSAVQSYDLNGDGRIDVLDLVITAKGIFSWE